MVSMQVGTTAEEEGARARGKEGPRFLGDSGLEELLVHMSAERATGGQGPAHKFLGHMPGEGAPCFQALGPQG